MEAASVTTTASSQISELCAGEAETVSFKILQQLLQAKKVSIAAIQEAFESTKCASQNAPKKKDPKHKNRKNDKKQAPTAEQPRRRHIALEIWYDGRNYTGLAENVGKDDDRSVERALFTAMKRAKLIEDRSSCSYSRSGRTDKGVSAAGQVIALKLKSAIAPQASLEAPFTTHTNNHGTPIADHELPTNSAQKILIWSPNVKNPDEPWKQKEVAEYPYERILNNLLPEDIRVLAWAPVSDTFSARFSTTMRTYRYFFELNGMDLTKMSEALGRLEGTHDFRNFCKMNVDEVSNFTRTIYRAKIVQTQDAHFFEIQGNAFLWHQIRCIVEILFLVGRGLEEPMVVDELFNIEKYPGKPAYPLADEAPLVLHECEYKQMQMKYSAENLWEVGRSLCAQRQKLLIAAAQIQNCMRKMASFDVSTDDVWNLFETKRERRRKKNPSLQCLAQNATRPTPEDTISWNDALDWLAEVGGFRLDQPFEQAHVPVLQRSKGTTYEEKVASRLGSSSQRRNRLVENQRKKQKISEDEDKAFHEVMKNGT